MPGFRTMLRKSGRPDLRWGGVGGGGRCYCAENVLKHAVNIRQHVVVPIPQHAVAVCFENLRALFLSCRSTVLASIDLDDDACRVTGEIGDVAANSNLATEMRARCRKPVAQVPPELPLGFRRSSAHRLGEAALRRHDRAITLRPDSRLVTCGHVIVSQLRPPPPTPPHKGEGSTPSLGREQTEFAARPTIQMQADIRTKLIRVVAMLRPSNALLPSPLWGGSRAQRAGWGS